MAVVAWIKLLLLSLAMVGGFRLFVVVFLGDYKTGPTIGHIKRHLNFSSGVDAGRQENASEPPKSPY